MAKRISEVERVTNFFQTASEDSAQVMVQVIKGILAKRFPAKVKKREKPKLVPSEKTAASEGVA